MEVLNLNFLELQRDYIKKSINENLLYVGFGDDNTDPTETDTTLGNEFYRKPRIDIELEPNFSIISAWLNSIEGNGEVIREYGLFKEDTAGQMFARGVKLDIEKNENIEVWVDFKIEYELELNVI